MAKLVGEDTLPWEGEGNAKDLLKRAGRFKEAVMGLLHRDPAQRTRVQTFVQQYAAIMSTTTQQMHGGSASLGIRSSEGSKTNLSQTRSTAAFQPTEGTLSTFDDGDRHVWNNP